MGIFQTPAPKSACNEITNVFRVQGSCESASWSEVRGQGELKVNDWCGSPGFKSALPHGRARLHERMFLSFVIRRKGMILKGPPPHLMGL